jgi:putative ABC transport system permease protein
VKLAVLLARGARSRLLLLALCALLGVAGRVAVDVLGQRIDAGLAREARTLLGGDVELSASRPLSAAQREAFHAALPPGTVTTSQRTLLAMAAAGERARTAEVRAVDPAWPLSGAVRLAGGTLDDLHGDQPAVLCEAGLLAYLGVEVGDTLRLGGTPFRIVGRLEALPGAGISFAPRLLVGARHLDATPLAGASSRVRHALLARFADPADADAVAGRLRAALGVPTGDSLGGFSGPPREPLAVRTAA